MRRWYWNSITFHVKRLHGKFNPGAPSAVFKQQKLYFAVFHQLGAEQKVSIGSKLVEDSKYAKLRSFLCLVLTADRADLRKSPQHQH